MTLLDTILVPTFVDPFLAPVIVHPIASALPSLSAVFNFRYLTLCRSCQILFNLHVYYLEFGCSATQCNHSQCSGRSSPRRVLRKCFLRPHFKLDVGWNPVSGSEGNFMKMYESNFEWSLPIRPYLRPPPSPSTRTFAVPKIRAGDWPNSILTMGIPFLGISLRSGVTHAPVPIHTCWTATDGQKKES